MSFAPVLSVFVVNRQSLVYSRKFINYKFEIILGRSCFSGFSLQGSFSFSSVFGLIDNDVVEVEFQETFKPSEIEFNLINPKSA